MVRDEPMCPRDLPQPLLDEAPPGVPPEDDLRRGEPLLCARVRWELRAQRRAELVRVEVEDGEVAQVARGQDTPVAAAAGHG